MDTLAWAYFKLGDYSQARDLLEKASASSPGAAIFNYHMGMVLYKTGEKEAARERLEKALSGDEQFRGRDVAARTLKDLS